MKILIYILAAFTLINAAGCRKYLDVQPKDKLIPTTAEDFRLLLDDQWTMTLTPGIGNVTTDDCMFTENEYVQLNDYFQNAYLWSKVVFDATDQVPDWNAMYKIIFHANTVLDGLAAYPGGAPSLRREVEGEASFHRAYAYFNLVNTFAKQYDPATAATDPGVPLRLKADIKASVIRNTVQEVYDQINADVKRAIELLSEKTVYKTRPAKAAACALAARIALQMGDYDEALLQSTNALALADELIDYNTVDPSSSTIDAVFPVSVLQNPEIIFLSSSAAYLGAKNHYTSKEFYDLYDQSDLRASLFFRLVPGEGNYQFTGSYNDSYLSNVPNAFTGFTVAELYLVRAECYARKGNKENALGDLNTLLVNRIESNAFIPVIAATAADALHIVLAERRKELVFRNTRLPDLKRLNKDPDTEVVVTRKFGAETYTLLPNDDKYVLPLPPAEIEAFNLPQNPR